MHLETLGFNATAPGTGGAVATAFSGDSAALRNTRNGSKVLAVNMWGVNQVAGYAQIMVPSMPDTQRGVRWSVRVPPGDGLAPATRPIPMQGLDTITASIAGSAVAGDIEQVFVTLHYEDTPGLSARLITVDELRSRSEMLMTVDLSITLTAAGGWTGSEALNNDSDLLRSDRTYAVIGARARADIGAVGIKGPDWANVRIGIPNARQGALRSESYLADLSSATGLATIPLLDGANRGSVLVDGADDENGTATAVTVFLAQLAT